MSDPSATKPLPSDDATRELFGDAIPPANPYASANSTHSTTPPGHDAPLPRPRIRVGAILWGVVLCTIAGLTLWVITDPDREAAFNEWVAGLPDGAAGLIALLVLGALLLLWGALAAVRRAQDRSAPRL